MSGTPWTPEEEALLVQHYRSYDWERLKRLLPGRTRASIAGRAAQLNLRAEKEPYWKEQEESFLREAFDHMTLAQIAAHLGRTETSVKLKAKRLGLRRRRRRSLTPSQIGRMMRICSKTVKWWVRRRWLRARRAPTEEKRIHLIEVADLVAFLRAHPERWDARRCPDLHVKLGLTRKSGEAALGDRPLWFKEKLAADIARRRRGHRWTAEEDRQLAHLVKQGLTYPAIARQLGRSANAIDKRVMRLGRSIWVLAKSSA